MARRALMRAGVLSLIFTLAFVSAQAARPPVALITIDLETGAVLAGAEVDALRHPASLTKLMTAYVAFEALEAGEVTETEVIAVTEAAAKQPPVGLGLGEGQTLPFGELLSAALVASANDAAVAVAVAVAGSEAKFVERMNRAAKELGLINTIFGSASGLPAETQMTTARDMALLAQALLRRFPERARVFSQSSVAVLGGRARTTNPLLGGYEGAVGLKTGFTCQAGYNIVGLAERDGRRILAVTLGHPNAATRNAAVRKQLDQGFKAGPSGAPLTPAPRPTAGSPTSAAACAPGGAGGSPSGWSVYLGAYRSKGGAQAALNRARKMSKGPDGRAYVGRRRLNSSWAALAHGFGRASARRFCIASRRAGLYCVVLSPARTRARAAPWR